jgi:hypothetical protein
MIVTAAQVVIFPADPYRDLDELTRLTQGVCGKRSSAAARSAVRRWWR